MDLDQTCALVVRAAAETGIAENDARWADCVAQALVLVRERTGVDFALYRRRTIERRLQNRALSLGISAPDDYIQHLRASADEAHLLLQRLTIKVSRFYRNRDSWEFLQASVLKELGGTLDAPLHVWSAGCATGEEAYSLAMLLADQGVRGTIIGTDVDRVALATAESGRYMAAAFADAPAAWLERFTNEAGSCREVSAELRAQITWQEDDLTEGPRLGSFELISCRNVLIYMQRSLQLRVFERLLGSLVDGGVLWLGEAEWPLTEFASKLEVISKKHRFFRKRRSDTHKT